MILKLSETILSSALCEVCDEYLSEYRIFESATNFTEVCESCYEDYENYCLRNADFSEL